MKPITALSRRHALRAMAAIGPVAWVVSACGSSPPVQLYRLHTAPPQPVAAAAAGGPTLQLMLPVRVPDYLDREAILLPQPGSGVLALSGHRWAESLRDAIPRVLRADLAALLGEGSVWTTPLPPGLDAERQLRVELLALEADADGRGVRLQARWIWTDARGRSVPRAELAQLQVPATGGSSSIGAVVDAHRLALWQLAVHIAASR